jgi:hypothetical protein
MPPDSDLARLARAWGSSVPTDQVAAFMRLPVDKRAMAIERVEALQALCVRPRPPSAVQAAAAEKLGISLQRLQMLMRSWTTPDIETITPHARKAARTPPPNPGRDIAERLVAKALRRDRAIAEPRLRRRVGGVCSRLGIATPARMTVRRLLDEARRRLPPEPILVDSLRDSAHDYPRPGETMLLTSISFRARIIQPDGVARRATALLLVDAGSGLIAAADYVAGIPELARRAAALIQAAPLAITCDWRRLRTLGVAPPLPAGPWRDQIEGPATLFKIEIEEVLFTRARRWVSSLFWRHPAGLDIAPRHVDAAPDPAWPTLSEAEFRLALEVAVTEHAAATERLIDKRTYPVDADDQSAVAAADLLALFGVTTSDHS